MNQLEKAAAAPKGPWILLVEDDQEMTGLLADRLKADGYRVMACTKAQEAIRLMKNQIFGCIVLDLHLDASTGDQVVENARKSPSAMNYATPILLISGNMDADLLVKVKKFIAGAMVKPFGLKEFAEKIQRLCPFVPDAAMKKVG